MAALLKGSAWRRKQNSVFTEHNGYFYVVRLNVYRNALRSVAEFGAKPMAVDPLLWDVLDMFENTKQPLSFRAWGAFTCPDVPLAEVELEEPGASPGQVAQALVSFLRDALQRVQSELNQRGFLALLREHQNHVERRSYAITEVVTLILNGEYDEATTLATDHESGKLTSAFGMQSNGSSFHQLALKWLATRTKVH